MNTKICSRCRSGKDLSMFCRDSARKDGLNPWCRECKKEAHRVAYKRPEVRSKAVLNSRRQWYKRYGITREIFAAMMERQSGLCAICGTKQEKKPLYVDHDHATNKIRGLLCQFCNSMLGMARDNPQTLGRAISYLCVGGAS